MSVKTTSPWLLILPSRSSACQRKEACINSLTHWADTTVGNQIDLNIRNIWHLTSLESWEIRCFLFEFRVKGLICCSKKLRISPFFPFLSHSAGTLAYLYIFFAQGDWTGYYSFINIILENLVFKMNMGNIFINSTPWSALVFFFNMKTVEMFKNQSQSWFWDLCNTNLHKDTSICQNLRP